MNKVKVERSEEFKVNDLLDDFGEVNYFGKNLVISLNRAKDDHEKKFGLIKRISALDYYIDNDRATAMLDGRKIMSAESILNNLGIEVEIDVNGDMRYQSTIYLVIGILYYGVTEIRVKHDISGDYISYVRENLRQFGIGNEYNIKIAREPWKR